VSGRVLDKEVEAGPIPERRKPPGERERGKGTHIEKSAGYTGVWRCRVCGYLCARNEPPGECPICKAGKERFEEFRVRLVGD